MNLSQNSEVDKDLFSTIGDAFNLARSSWEALKLNLGTFILLSVIPIIIFTTAFFILLAFAFASLVSDFSNSEFSFGFILPIAITVIIGGLACSPFLIGSTITQLASAKGEVIGFGQALKSSFKYILPGIGLFILVGLSVLVGMIFLIIPGFLAAFFFSQSLFILIDKNTTVIEAMKQSYSVVKNHWKWVVALVVVNMAVSAVGYFPYIGWIISTIGSVIYYCLPAIIYVRIRE